ncbi:hypothetical protein [Dokdonia sp.]|uniref:hypothetical protein n=1 Tax=Dokdonia sp. TaxID=2024995 RepID=UPI0032657177
MEIFDEFSPIEQAAMEQSPASETDVRYNFIGVSSFIDDIAEGIGDIVEGVGEVAENIGDHVVAAGEGAVNDFVEIGENVAAVAEGAAGVVEAVAGGVVIDRVFTKRQIELLKSTHQECSVDELINLRSSLMKATSMKK